MLVDIPPRDDAARLQELRHRLGNSLQLIQSTIERRRRKADDPAVRQELGILLQAVASICELQRSLETRTTIDVATHLTVVSRQWRELLGERGIELRLNLMSVEAPEATASTLAMIAQELVANCVEHAYPAGRRGCVHVSLLIDEKGFTELSVTDDGAGLRGAAAKPRGGLRLVRRLARRIGGTFSLHDGQGVVASVWFPLPANEG